jgi:hypothetical protein
MVQNFILNLIFAKKYWNIEKYVVSHNQAIFLGKTSSKFLCMLLKIVEVTEIDKVVWWQSRKLGYNRLNVH